MSIMTDNKQINNITRALIPYLVPDISWLLHICRTTPQLLLDTIINNDRGLYVSNNRRVESLLDEGHGISISMFEPAFHVISIENVGRNKLLNRKFRFKSITYLLRGLYNQYTNDQLTQFAGIEQLLSLCVLDDRLIKQINWQRNWETKSLLLELSTKRIDLIKSKRWKRDHLSLCLLVSISDDVDFIKSCIHKSTIETGMSYTGLLFLIIQHHLHSLIIPLLDYHIGK